MLPFFEDLEEINTAFEIKEHKRQVTITKPYQCSIAIYQLTKLHMLEFYYDLVFGLKLVQMDTDSMYKANSGEFNEIVRPEIWEEYTNEGKAKFLSTSKYHDRSDE